MAGSNRGVLSGLDAGGPPDGALSPDPDVPLPEAPDPDRPDTTGPAPRPRRRRRRTIAAVVLVLALPALWSYGRALTGPGSDSFTARTAEWMRGHHLGTLVNWGEHLSYRLHPPRTGGQPKISALPVALPASASASSSTTAAGLTPSGGSSPSAEPATPTPVASTRPASPLRAGALPAPAALVSPASPTLPGEGSWTPVGPAVAGAPGAYVTQVRPDATHTSYLDAVVWFDPHRLMFQQYFGHFFPHATASPDQVPPEVRAALVAAFEGGFRPNDSRGGLWLQGQEVTPLRAGGATLAITKDGAVDVGALGRDIVPSDQYQSLRQNLDLIVNNGQPVAELATDPNRSWGFTGPRNNEYVWRSGVGVTRDGAVIWVGGPTLSIEDLAQTLVRAGAVRGMQLDINQEWVQFNTYAVGPDGVVHGTKLVRGMGHTNDRYLSADTRDFVAVLARTTPLP